MHRPQRWDEPFDPGMSDSDVSALLSIEPLSTIDPAAFSQAISLHGVIKNDCRILDLDQGDIIVREGDYGSSAFLILFGQALVSLESLPASVLGRPSKKKKSWGETFAQLWRNSTGTETRDYSDRSASPSQASRSALAKTNMEPASFCMTFPASYPPANRKHLPKAKSSGRFLP